MKHNAVSAPMMFLELRAQEAWLDLRAIAIGVAMKDAGLELTAMDMNIPTLVDKIGIYGG